MPCIWGQHNGSQLFCPVVILPANAQLGPSGGAYQGPSQIVQALIDTGATTTAITNNLATRLQMQPFGKVPIHGVGGVQPHNSYLFKVGFAFALPPGSPPTPGLPPITPGQAQVQFHVLMKTIHGCEFHSGSANFDVLLGMDVIVPAERSARRASQRRAANLEPKRLMNCEAVKASASKERAKVLRR
jgi:hypothetical protein